MAAAAIVTRIPEIAMAILPCSMSESTYADCEPSNVDIPETQGKRSAGPSQCSKCQAVLQPEPQASWSQTAAGTAQLLAPRKKWLPRWIQLD